MSLLESDDFTYYGGKASSNTPHLEEERTVTSSLEPKVRVKSGDLAVDAQKMSSFSLRRKKDKDNPEGGKTHKKNKSAGKIQPPDSPKSKSGPSPNVKSSRKQQQQQYTHLLENEASSDDEDEDFSSAFVLSRGRQAREKRGSFKSPSGGEGSGGELFTTTNPSTTDSTSDTSPVKSVIGASLVGGVNFPVTFTPPKVAQFTSHSEAAITPEENLDLMLALDKAFGRDSEPIPVLPPPPQGVPSSAPVTNVPQATPNSDDVEWFVTEELYEKCTGQFKELCPSGGLLSGEKARDFFLRSNLPVNELSRIWYACYRVCMAVYLLLVNCLRSVVMFNLTQPYVNYEQLSMHHFLDLTTLRERRWCVHIE